MKINVHTHVFNFRSVMTKEAIRIFLNRLTDKSNMENGSNGLPNYLVTPLKKVLQAAWDDRSIFSDGSGLRQVLVEMVKHRDFAKHAPASLRRSLTRALENMPFVGSASEGLHIIKAVFGSILTADPGDDTEESTVSDFLDFIRVGFLPSIDAVTDHLMQQMGPRDIAVALPMDIVDNNASESDLALFPQQMTDTVAQACRYPGRLLPYFKVNPARKDHFELMSEYLLSGKCVGLKLYPPLGYSVDSPAMKDVVNLCASVHAPIISHCNKGGFRRSLNDADKAAPGHWVSHLESNPALKVCFAHFGGDENFTSNSLPSTGWASDIVNLMQRFPGQVYADVSYHVAQMSSSSKGKTYRRHMQKLFEDPITRGQILWGTDFHLVRQRASDVSYTRYFEQLLGSDSMQLIALENCSNYLGLPGSERGIGHNIERHAEWLLARRTEWKSAPAPWLAALTGTPEAAVPSPPQTHASWDQTRRVHLALYAFLWDSSYPYFTAEIRQRIQLDFQKTGSVRMGEMSHLNPPPIGGAEAPARQLVTDLISFLRVNNVQLRHGSAETNAFEQLWPVAARAQATVASLADALDHHYTS